MAAADPKDTTLVNKGDAAKFRELQQRWFMRSKPLTWTAFFLACFTQCIVTLPSMGWQTLQQNMLDEGCLYSKLQLDEIDNWACGLSIAAFLPIGLLFDYLGPLALAVGGTLISALGTCGMSAALLFPGYLSWLLGPSYVVNLVFCYANSFGLLSYLWILHEHNFTVTAFYQGSDVLAGSGVLISLWLTHSYGVTTGVFFLALGVIGLSCTMISYCAMPTFEEARLLKKYALRRTAFEGEEKPSIDDIFEYDELAQNQDFFGAAQQQIVDVIWISCRMHPGNVLNFYGNTFAMYMATMTFLLYQYAYYLSMFDMDKAIYLVDLFPIMYGLVGPCLAICMGVFFDQISVELAIFFGNSLNLIFVILLVIPSVGSQIAAMIVFVIAFTYVKIICIRFAQMYSPPESFGTFQGGFAFIFGCLQIVIVIILKELSMLVFSGSVYLSICSQVLLWGGLLFLTGLSLCAWINLVEPLKKLGVASEAELREFQSRTESGKQMQGSK